MKKLLTCLAIVSCLASSAFAAEVAFEEDHSLPLVFVNVTVKAGVATDPAGQSGLTNFMGEMLLRGTRSKTKEQIDLAIDQMGAELEVEARSEALILRGSVLSSQLEPFLALLEEIITQPSFPENEIRKLKSEITSGILQELGNDSSLGSRSFNEFLFRGHPYGNPVLGKVKDVEKLGRQSVIDQYSRLFREKYLLMVGTGDARTDRIRGWMDRIVQARNAAESAAGPRAAKDLPKLARPEDSSSRRLLIVDKPDRTQTQIFVGQTGIRMTDSSFFPLYLGNHAFGGGTFTSRLMVEIRVKKGWSYGANSYFKHGLLPRSWQAHLFPAEKDTPPALATTLQMISDLKARGITPEEFETSKVSLVNSSGFIYNTPKKRVENTLLERTLDLPEGFMKSYGPKLSEVRIEQVNEALKGFLRPEQLAITVVGTAKNIKEPLAKAAGVSADKVEVRPYTEE